MCLAEGEVAGNESNLVSNAGRCKVRKRGAALSQEVHLGPRSGDEGKGKGRSGGVCDGAEETHSAGGRRGERGHHEDEIQVS